MRISSWMSDVCSSDLGSAYYYDYKDFQVLRVVAVPGGGAATLITNAATSEIKGFELELVARPSDRFEANLSYAYTDAKYKSFPFNATTRQEARRVGNECVSTC